MTDRVTRRLLIAAAGTLALTLAGPGLAAGATPGPLDFAKALYALPSFWSDVTEDDAAMDRYLTPELAKLIRENYAKDDFESALDYDPLIQGQDWDEIKPKFMLENNTGKEASVHVAFENFGEPISLTLELALTAKGWRLADIHPEDGSSLVLEVTELNAAKKP